MATKVKPSRLQVTWTPQAWCVPVYVNEDCFQWWSGWWGWWWGAEWWNITGTLCNQIDLQWALNCKLDASALSDTNYWWAWNGDTTHTPTKNAIYTKLHTMDVEIWNKAADNTVVKLSWNQTINWTKTFWTSPVVPSKCAAAVNCDTAIATEAQVYNVAQAIPTDNCQLANGCDYATCCYVNDSINSVTAYYITKNAQWDQWACYAELANATTFYSWWVQRTPTRNDYTIVLDDECYCDATTRYIYNTNWEYQYTVNETALTQSQLDALNSWITAAKVTCYDAIPIITDNCQIANWCGYTTCTGTLTSSDLACYACCCDIPTDNCQLSNGCWYTTCTGTLVASDISWLVAESCIACINWCCLTQWGNICICWGGWGGWIQLAPNSEYNVAYHWYWPQACFDALSQYYTCCANDTAYFTT